MEEGKKIKMEDDQKYSKWKTTKIFKMEDVQQNQNGRQPKKSKWKMRKKWKTTKNIQNGR